MYADSMLEPFGELQDSNVEGHSLLTRLEKQLWNAEYKLPSGETKRVVYSPQRPVDAKVRLDRLIRRALQVRQNYHAQLYK